MSDPMTEAMARAIARIDIEMWVRDPEALGPSVDDDVETHWQEWENSARAARKAALEWMEGNVDEGMVQAACDATFGPEPMTPAEVHRLGLTAAVRHLSERSE